MQHLPKKKPRKIGEAVFRGINNIYTFSVYAISGPLTDAPAVYIISRRVVDKTRMAHHRAVCIGQVPCV
ncbi:MAG TPA: hypothetical protein VK468_06680, partial [Pyrinomonadaceae bacterium]|nr:hypothetical protein [Pyrinomonadaceae bacterium]